MDFVSTLENLDLKTDMHQIQPKVAKHNLARYLKNKTEANVLLLTVSYDLLVFKKQLYEAIINVAQVLNRNLEIKKPHELCTQEYKERPIGVAYWRDIYNLK